ncbi:hypothetical protein HUT16_28010 [Kitasatospora sp. NA04385]|uniref:hypothetical protein n=1 Tax=Kitasatospora sp. NA04385 TaxID=2742135 RepID=UPI0011643C4F|nr:hypothetical protein [Kitasatospora sp. NA04385]QDJ74276.1 hypothetical protein [Kitasatospora sp.]QKW22408.1 hypothetical protein HUT16_28010 [Kitasatospora sp. NA04385]
MPNRERTRSVARAAATAAAVRARAGRRALRGAGQAAGLLALGTGLARLARARSGDRPGPRGRAPAPGAGGREVLGWGTGAVLLAAGPGKLVLDLARVVTLNGREVAWPDFARRVCLVAGGAAWTRAALLDRRGRTGGCPECGRPPGHRPERVPRWPAYVAAAVPVVGFAVPHWLWAAGVPFGIPEQGAAELSAPGTAGVVATLGVLASGAGVLTVGLARPWGERFPRWVPALAGRPVPPWLAEGPPLVAAAALTPYGLHGVAAAIGYATGLVEPGPERLGGIEHPGNQLTYATFLVWGTSLGAAAIAHHYRTRGRCRACGRGERRQLPANAR